MDFIFGSDHVWRWRHWIPWHVKRRLGTCNIVIWSWGKCTFILILGAFFWVLSVWYLTFVFASSLNYLSKMDARTKQNMWYGKAGFHFDQMWPLGFNSSKATHGTHSHMNSSTIICLWFPPFGYQERKEGVGRMGLGGLVASLILHGYVHFHGEFATCTYLALCDGKNFVNNGT